MRIGIALNRRSGHHRNDDVLDVCEHLSQGIYGTKTNALLQLVLESPTFQKTLAELKAAQAKDAQPAEAASASEGV